MGCGPSSTRSLPAGSFDDTPLPAPLPSAAAENVDSELHGKTEVDADLHVAGMQAKLDAVALRDGGGPPQRPRRERRRIDPAWAQQAPGKLDVNSLLFAPDTAPLHASPAAAAAGRGQQHTTAGAERTCEATKDSSSPVAAAVAAAALAPCLRSGPGRVNSRLGVVLGSASALGGRAAQEDRVDVAAEIEGDDSVVYAAVYDGHGGDQVAEYLARNLPARIVAAVRAEMTYEAAFRRAFARAEAVSGSEGSHCDLGSAEPADGSAVRTGTPTQAYSVSQANAGSSDAASSLTEDTRHDDYESRDRRQIHDDGRVNGASPLRRVMPPLPRSQSALFSVVASLSPPLAAKPLPQRTASHPVAPADVLVARRPYDPSPSAAPESATATRATAVGSPDIVPPQGVVMASSSGSGPGQLLPTDTRPYAGVAHDLTSFDRRSGTPIDPGGASHGEHVVSMEGGKVVQHRRLIAARVATTYHGRTSHIGDAGLSSLIEDHDTEGSPTYGRNNDSAFTKLSLKDSSAACAFAPQRDEGDEESDGTPLVMLHSHGSDSSDAPAALDGPPPQLSAISISAVRSVGTSHGNAADQSPASASMLQHLLPPTKPTMLSPLSEREMASLASQSSDSAAATLTDDSSTLMPVVARSYTTPATRANDHLSSTSPVVVLNVPDKVAGEAHMMRRPRNQQQLRPPRNGQIASTAHDMAAATTYIPGDPDFRRILTYVFHEFDKEFAAEAAAGRLPATAGACVVLVLFWGDALIVANVGDCEAWLCRGGHPIELTCPHKVLRASEAERIRSTGGVVTYWHGQPRVGGALLVSRAIGVPMLKTPYTGVVADPFVRVARLKSSPPRNVSATSSDAGPPSARIPTPLGQTPSSDAGPLSSRMHTPPGHSIVHIASIAQEGSEVGSSSHLQTLKAPRTIASPAPASLAPSVVGEDDAKDDDFLTLRVPPSFAARYSNNSECDAVLASRGSPQPPTEASFSGVALQHRLQPHSLHATPTISTDRASRPTNAEELPRSSQLLSYAPLLVSRDCGPVRPAGLTSGVVNPQGTGETSAAVGVASQQYERIDDADDDDGDDEFIVLGSDGLFDVFHSRTDLCARIKRALRATGDADAAAAAVVREATVDRRSSDNVSLALIVLNQGGVRTMCAGAGGATVGYASRAGALPLRTAFHGRPDFVADVRTSMLSRSYSGSVRRAERDATVVPARAVVSAADADDADPQDEGVS